MPLSAFSLSLPPCPSAACLPRCQGKRRYLNLRAPANAADPLCESSGYFDEGKGSKYRVRRCEVEGAPQGQEVWSGTRASPRVQYRVRVEAERMMVDPQGTFTELNK